METTANYKPNVEVVSDPESLAQRSVALFISDAEKAIKAKGTFYVAISGGHTPKRFFELLSEVPKAKVLPWDKIQLFWVDERYVPPDSQWSNYKLAADTFLAKVAIPQKNIHRIPTEYNDFQAAAQCYEETIRKVFGLKKKNQLPKFDLIVLGMGAEGHTGSLFPNSYAPFDTEDLACVVYVLDEKLNRITLTHPVLCAASHLAVLVSGEEKAAILKEVLTHEPDEVQYPIHTLWPILNKVTWLVDSKAAKFLPLR
ncbi:MAG: 6-phosphogluconolactonase [Sedimentisphaerales bacterium]